MIILVDKTKQKQKIVEWRKKNIHTFAEALIKITTKSPIKAFKINVGADVIDLMPH